MKSGRVATPLTMLLSLSLVMLLAGGGAGGAQAAAAVTAVQDDGMITPAAASQKSVTVTVGVGGAGADVQVKHVIHPSKESAYLRLVDVGRLGDMGISATPAPDAIRGGGGAEHRLTPEGGAVVIPPSNAETVVEYVLKDAILTENGISKLEFTYLETTIFLLPDDIKTFFVNDRAIYLAEKDGFACHGCQMTLEYVREAAPAKTESISLPGGQAFLVGITTRAETDSFSFDSRAGEISFRTGGGERQFVTVIVPMELMREPYAVSLDGDGLFFQNYLENGTHAWLSMRPDAAGTIAIGGAVPPALLQAGGDLPPGSAIMGALIAVPAAAAAAAFLLIAWGRRKRRLSPR